MKRLRFWTPLLLTLLVISLPAIAQTSSCPLKIQELPELRGFKLGMTIIQLKQRYPKLFEEYEFKPDANGYIELDLTGYYDSPLSKFMNETERKGLDGMKLAFLDNRLVRVRMVYKEVVEWESVDQFLNSIVRNLKLPEAARWKTTGERTRQLDCAGASIEVRLDPRVGHTPQAPSIALVQQGIDDVLRER
jgi:hypothetical protein